jgi:hypothetical protein
MEGYRTLRSFVSEKEARLAELTKLEHKADQLEGAIAYVINRMDPPFIKEKLSHYTQGPDGADRLLAKFKEHLEKQTLCLIK